MRLSLLFTYCEYGGSFFPREDLSIFVMTMTLITLDDCGDDPDHIMDTCNDYPHDASSHPGRL